MKVLLLHLSDIHIESNNDPILQKGKDIAACVYSSLYSASHIFIVISGDVAFSGKDSQYTLAEGFLKEIKETIQREKKISVDFIIVPGNHDCDFDLGTMTRNLLVESIEKDKFPQIDSSVIEACTTIQKSFFNFRKILEGDIKVEDDLLWRSSCFEVEKKILRFECLNVSWVSKSHDLPGFLHFPHQMYTDKNNSNADFRFIVLHHPLNWFNKIIYRSFRMLVHQLADIVISGHEHQGNVGNYDDAESGESAFVEGCILQDKKSLSESSFNLILLDLDKKKFASSCYKWDGNRYVAMKNESWSDYHDLPIKKTKQFTISKSFQETLDDPGAFYLNPYRSQIILSDIYIYPDLLKKGNNGGDRKRNFINSEELLSPKLISGGVLIEGEEKFGCTSLLYQLYRQYHYNGFVPLFLNGKNLKKTNESEIDKLIEHEVEFQYGKDQIIAFNQLPTSKKLLLLDDFDDGPLKSNSARVEVLCALRKRFGHLVVTVNEMFEMREMLFGDVSQELISMEHYQIQPFGYLLRSKLIEKWFSIFKDGTDDDANIISKCDQAERLISMVMAKSLIPSIPLYLLTLLQSIEAGRSGDFKDSALGYYYQYLLSQAFQNSGVKPNKLTEVFQYVAHLASEFHLQKKRELTEADLRDFNTKFSQKWHTVDFNSRIDILINARVLCRVGENYKFRYPYIYYYLKGLYLSDNLNDQSIREYIEHCCKHLYVRDYANTVLFLAHHTNDDFILKTISEGLRGLFHSCLPITFNGDTSGIANLIEDAPTLTYSGESPIEYRERRNRIKDELDDGQDGLAESEEASKELSRVAQMTMLFKTIEILGQVLKNQYAKILRTQKSILIEELFNGPLRAIRDFYNFLEKNPDAFTVIIEAALQRSKKTLTEKARKRIARDVVAGIIQFFTFAFVMRVAQGANSDSLIEDVRAVVMKNGTLAFKLIDLCIDLDSPKPIPRGKLEQLYLEAKKDFIAERLIKIIVINRLYMFKTSEKDMQWLSGKLGLDIGAQHAITYQERKRRLLK